MKLLSLVFLLAPGSLQADQPTPARETQPQRLSLTLAEAIGADAAESASAAFDADQILSWELYVPPGLEQGPPSGLLVWISPTPSGRIPSQWKATLDSHGIIWIGGNDSGNRVPVARRSILALVAAEVARQRFEIDPRRVYLAGFSGGGKVASMVAPNATELFRGAAYFMGVEFFERYPHHDRAHIANQRFVFVSGSEDFNLRPTRRVFQQYRDAGVEQVDLVVFPRLGHRLPDGTGLDRILRFLEGAPGASDSSR